MNREQFTYLLARIQVFDNRQIGKTTAEAWWPIIGDLDYDDAVAAVQTHFRDRPEVYLQPGHIVAGVKRAHEARLPHYDHSQDNRGDAPPPRNLVALGNAWRDPEAWAREIEVYNDQLREARMPQYIIGADASEQWRQSLTQAGSGVPA